jgi:hypothetical protein
MTTDLTTTDTTPAADATPAAARAGTPAAEVPAAEVVAVAAALVKAGRWDTADRLLAATRAGDTAGRAALALAAAAAAVDRDMFTGTHRAPVALAAAEPLVAAAGDLVARWDLATLRLYAGYQAELFGRAQDEGEGDGGRQVPAFGPDGRDPARAAELMARADRLTVDAPDAGRRGWASFYGGLVADNLMGDGTGGAGRFRSALRLGEQVGDGLLTSYALRHLGGHDEEDGDLAAARERWEKAADLRAADGHLTGVLAQQIWLATLADREGDHAGARAVATEVRRWATALGLPWLVAQADQLAAATPGAATRGGSTPADATPADGAPGV